MPIEEIKRQLSNRLITVKGAVLLALETGRWSQQGLADALGVSLSAIAKAHCKLKEDGLIVRASKYTPIK